MWKVDLEGMDPVRRQRLAAQLSLPYVAGTRPPMRRRGVIRHDRERAFQSLNLMVSGHKPEALLLDMEGRILHRWRHDFEGAFPGEMLGGNTAFWRRAHLLPDGSLLAVFQGAGLIKVDLGSHLVWRAAGVYYNDLHVDDLGHIFGISKQATRVPELWPDRTVLEDFIEVLGGDGRLLRRISLLQALRTSPFARFLRSVGAAPDIFHTNTVEVLDGRLESASDAFAAGNILVSLREIDLIGAVDPVRERFVWARRGVWRRQHQPTPWTRGRILLFDNQGNGGRARVLGLDLPSGDTTWQYPPAGAPALRSHEYGSCQPLPNGNVLITESERGRALEVTPEGEVVWEYSSPFRTGPRNELVANLFEMVRLPEGSTPWLNTAPNHPTGPRSSS